MCCSVVFGVTLRLLVINISSLCSAINNLRRLPPAIRVTTCGTMVQRRRIDNTWPAAALRARSEARYRLRSAISAYPTCIRPPIRGVPVGLLPCRLAQKKLEWLGYPMVKNVEDMFIRFDRIHERDRRTPQRLRPRLSRGNEQGWRFY